MVLSQASPSLRRIPPPVPAMTQPSRRSRPLLRAAALGCAVLWGMVEFVALCRTRLPQAVFRHD